MHMQTRLRSIACVYHDLGSNQRSLTVKKLWGSGRAEVITNLVKDGNSTCSMLGARALLQQLCSFNARLVCLMR